MAPWLPTASDVARTLLHTVTRSLDGMRADVERELVEHARCRRDVEALIERLIAGLDDFDGDAELEGQHGPGGAVVDPDLDLDVADEPHDEADEGNAEPSLGWTATEAAKGLRPCFAPCADLEAEHDGREPDDEGDVLDRGEDCPADDHALSEPETYGRGWQHDALQAADDERLFSGVTVGMLATYSRGRLADVVAIAGEGRARA
ncbi:hypothetical protein IHQ68_13750 [Chelatococcus sambhunathii]|uniref:Uncharacterized protein n=2 Tax=Chelatococcus sambhunathii TaxID=363953 RepID=A0ABU1DHT6_9HYPH|nr:hypothetical protein [Chelatococcus sambhunathii]